MSWYRAESGDSDDPRLLKLARSLGIRGPLAVFTAHGLVCRLRERVAAKFEDGVLDGMDPSDVDAWTTDDCGRFLVELGFLVWVDAESPKLALEDWEERAGNSKWAVQKRNQRASQREKKQMSADILKTVQGQSADCPQFVHGTHTNERTNIQTDGQPDLGSSTPPKPKRTKTMDPEAVKVIESYKADFLKAQKVEYRPTKADTEAISKYLRNGYDAEQLIGALRRASDDPFWRKLSPASFLKDQARVAEFAPPKRTARPRPQFTEPVVPEYDAARNQTQIADLKAQLRLA